MRLLADLHVSPRTVTFLRALGHDTIRSSEVLAPTASDQEIIDFAFAHQRAVLTQDLDFSTLIALSGKTSPSLISLRLAHARSDYVNSILERVLPVIQEDVEAGAIVTVEDRRIRRRRLPIA